MKTTYEELCEVKTSIAAKNIIIVALSKDAKALRKALDEAMSMLSNIEYWETTPNEYRDRIKKLQNFHQTQTKGDK